MAVPGFTLELDYTIPTTLHKEKRSIPPFWPTPGPDPLVKILIRFFPFRELGTEP